MERPFRWRAALAKLVRTAPAAPARQGPCEGPGDAPVVAEGWHHCLICPAVLSSAARLKIHAYRVHQVKHVLRSFTFSESCLSCGRMFWTRERCFHHLLRSARCAAATQAHMRPMTDAEVEALDAASAGVQRDNCRKGLSPRFAHQPCCRMQGPLPFWAVG